MINEGAKILEEGYALRAADIDVIYLTGYGFPALSRRSHVVRRHGRLEEGSRPHRANFTASMANFGSLRRCSTNWRTPATTFAAWDAVREHALAVA